MQQPTSPSLANGFVDPTSGNEILRGYLGVDGAVGVVFDSGMGKDRYREPHEFSVRERYIIQTTRITILFIEKIVYAIT